MLDDNISLKEEFKEKIAKTKQDEKEEQNVEDTKIAEEIISGEQELYIKNYGYIIFQWPNTRLFLEGDRVYAKFKAEHLRKGDIMTEAQLKAIYNRPITVLIDDKEVKVGNGEWTAENENDLFEVMPKKVKDLVEQFNFLREKVIDYKEKDNIKELEKVTEDAYDIYKKINELKLKQLDLQSKRMLLFADSLEDQAIIEKIKLFAPSCIISKETRQPIWKNSDDLLNSKHDALRIISLFRLFLSGISIDFFIDLPPGQTL